MEKKICHKCNKRFLYDPKLVPYIACDDNVRRLTKYEKIMRCPYCGTAFVLDRYYKEWNYELYNQW